MGGPDVLQTLTGSKKGMKEEITEANAFNVNGEPLLTYLMPISVLIFFTSRMRDPDLLLEHILFFASWQWLWSLKNVILGPLKKDSGIILWALGATSAYLKHRQFTMISALIAGSATGATGLFIISHKPWKNDFTRTARYLRKTTFFAKTFTAYLLVNSAFWYFTAFQVYNAPDALFM